MKYNILRNVIFRGDKSYLPLKRRAGGALNSPRKRAPPPLLGEAISTRKKARLRCLVATRKADDPTRLERLYMCSDVSRTRNGVRHLRSIHPGFHDLSSYLARVAFGGGGNPPPPKGRDPRSGPAWGGGSRRARLRGIGDSADRNPPERRKSQPKPTPIVATRGLPY